VATALDPDGRTVGLGQGRLDLEADLDAPAIQDAAPPVDVPDFGDPSVDPPDAAIDLGRQDPAADLALEDVVFVVDARLDAGADGTPITDASADQDPVDPVPDADAPDADAPDADVPDADVPVDVQASDAADVQPPPLDLDPPHDARPSGPDVREGTLDAALDPAPTRRGPTGGCDCAIGAARPGHIVPWVALVLLGRRPRARRARQST
jgi:hypothetical protein